MKITRYLNGKKINEDTLKKTTLKNTVISEAISKLRKEA